MNSIEGNFGKLTVIRFDHKDKQSHKYYLCRCDCGKEKIIRMDYLKSGRITSCGCNRHTSERQKEAARRMGLKNRKHFGCIVCGSDKHYAKGLCQNCYAKYKRGTLDYVEPNQTFMGE